MNLLGGLQKFLRITDTSSVCTCTLGPPGLLKWGSSLVLDLTWAVVAL